MRFLKKIRGEMSVALLRYPLTALFLVAAAIANGLTIEGSLDYSNYLLTFLVGGFLAFTLQAVWERFFNKKLYRLLLMALGLVLTLAYFLVVRNVETIDLVTGLRTMVILLALAVAYIYLPSVKSQTSFSHSFLIAFKAFFTALLFSLVLYLGISLILGAVDLLLFKIPTTLYLHNLNVVGIIFAPLYFLSLIPLYPGHSNSLEDQGELKTHYPKFLEILISYIIIPLLSVYTLILVLYIGLNVSGDFWTDNRLEPMLVGFAIAVIVIHILASGLKNSFVDCFQKIAPKVLVVLVLFQIIASLLRIQEMGISHGRYYVILFGFFALVSGLIISLKPFKNVDKNGLIALLFIVVSLFSITPPLDAFTVAYNNQMGRLTRTLEENNMIVSQEIIPNSEVSEKDQAIITDAVNYLMMMDYQVAYLDEDFDLYEDFYQTFGFYQSVDFPYDQASIYLELDPEVAIDISNYDVLLNYNAYYEKEAEEEFLIGTFEKSAKGFNLIEVRQSQASQILLKDEEGNIVMVLDMKDVFDYFKTLANDDFQGGKQMSPAEATFTLENEEARLSLVARFIGINKNSEEPNNNGDFYLMIKIKE